MEEKLNYRERKAYIERITEARKCYRIIRAKVKEILHLLSWTSTDWILSKEGLGLK